MDIPPPKCLQAPLRIPNNLLMGPGPANCSPRVMKALSEPVLNVLDTNLLRIMDEVKEGIRYVFQTKNDLTLALTTAGHGGMEAIFCNLTEPGNKILVAVNGIWGQRAADMAGRYGGDLTFIQKAIEIIYQDMEISIKIIKTEDNSDKPQPKQREKIIEFTLKEGGDTSYASVLKEMRSTLNFDEAGAGIRKIRKTQSGRIQIVAREVKAGSLDKLREEARSKLGASIIDARQVGGADVKNIIIRDLDIVTSRNEIIDALLRTAGSKKVSDDIKVHTLKEAKWGGSQVATAAVPRWLGEKVVRAGTIKIGWVSCRVEEIFRPIRCFKCQCYGHRTSECTAKEFSLRGKCLNCGGTDHRQSQCQNKARCYVCDTEGHNAGSMSCPRYRAAVAEMRKNKKGGSKGYPKPPAAGPAPTDKDASDKATIMDCDITKSVINSCDT